MMEADQLYPPEYKEDVVPHPNAKKYPNQNMFIINIDDYAYLVPFVETEEITFLKTIIPSRKATKKYLTAVRQVLRGEKWKK